MCRILSHSVAFSRYRKVARPVSNCSVIARRTPPTLVYTRPVSGYGVTFFREYEVLCEGRLSNRFRTLTRVTAHV